MTQRPAARGARLERPILLLLLAAFAALGIARLGPACLIEPDTPDYLFTARSLATFRGYVEIDHPAEPLHAFRPPGLPLLLAPLARVKPFDVTTAKALVLALAVATLWLAYRCGRRIAGPAGALAALALLASSPYTLLHATEVITEIPYLAVMLGVVALSMRGEPDRRALIGLGALLAFLPFLRTIGVALIAAVGLWGLLARKRRAYAVAAGAALLPTLLWSWRNAAAGGPTYLGSIRSDLAASGVTGTIRKAAASAWDYLDRLSDVLLPGLSPGEPLYERFLLGQAPDLAVPGWMTLALTVVVAGLALRGMWERRDREGLAVALYGFAYLAALALYPPKHERLAWPLVPLLWIYAPLGVRVGAVALRRASPAAAGFATGVAVFAALALSGWQLASSVATVVPNVQRIREGDAFYRRVPPMYYADWQAAGRYLAEHAPPHARVLTRHSDVGFTARRWQDSLRLEELSPREWRSRIAELSARYLVVPTSDLGRLFFWPALEGDPVYRYTPVFEGGDVVVYEIAPNRSGTVEPARPDRTEEIETCRAALELHPGRVDLVRRLADLLHESNQDDEALDVLQAALDRVPGEVRLYKTRAELLLDLDRPEDALTALDRARELPEAELLSSSLARLVDRARRDIAGRERPLPERVAEHVRSARWKMEILDWNGALEAADAAHRLAPADPRLAYVLGEAFQRLGRWDEARTLFERAGAGGVREAAPKLELLRRMHEVGGDPPPSEPRPYLELAELYTRDGTPGRALALLESVADRFPGSLELKLRLAVLELFYGLAERAEPRYREVLAARPDDAEATQGLARCESLLRAPRL